MTSKEKILVCFQVFFLCTLVSSLSLFASTAQFELISLQLSWLVFFPFLVGGFFFLKYLINDPLSQGTTYPSNIS